MNSLVSETMKNINRENEFVFYNPKTNDRIKDIKTGFHTACKKAGINDFRFHDLRHTAASWMVMEGVSLYAVKEILGHSDIKTTQRYAHLSPGYLENEIGKLDNYLLSENDSINDSSALERVAI